MKKIICCGILFVFMLFGASVQAAESGSCGTGVTFVISNGTLYISGSGAMDDWSGVRYIPWYAESKDISHVVIADGITHIGKHAFNNLVNLKEVTIGTGVETIGNNAFSSTTALEKIYYNAENVQDLTKSNNVFYNAGKTSTSIQLIIGDGVTRIPAYLFNPSNSTSYTPRITSISMPETVTEIGSYAFAYNSYITSNPIGSGVVTLGDYSFTECRALLEIAIPASTTKIGDGAFKDCYTATTLTIGKNVQNIGIEAFRGTSGLLNIVWNTDKVSDLQAKNNIFYDAGRNKSAIELTVGEGVTRIPAHAFNSTNSTSYQPRIISVVLPDSLKEIGDYAFGYNSYIKSVSMGNNVEKIGAYAFYNNKAITTMNLSESLGEIGGYAFYGCSKVTSIVIPDSVTKIAEYAFCGCNNADIRLGKGVKFIGDYAFQGCSKMTTLTIDENVEHIGTQAFYQCRGLTQINWNSDNVGDFASSNKIFYEAGQTGGGITVTFGGDTKRIPAYLFYPYSSAYYAPKITTIVLGDGVKVIGANSFRCCSYLKNIELGSVESIEDNAFYDCGNIGNLVLPDTLKTIGEKAFNCSQSALNGISSLTVGSGLESVGANAFYGNKRIEVNISDIDAWCDISFKSGTANPTYYSAPYMNGEPITEVTIAEGETEIKDFTFYGFNNLQTVNLPKTMTDIGIYAFANCTGLTQIEFPKSLKSIKDYAFDGCSAITDVYYGGTEKEWADVIGTSLGNTYIYNANMHFGYSDDVEGDFAEGLYWTVADSVLTVSGQGSMGQWASETDAPWYYKKDTFTKVVIGEGVTDIADYAFYNYAGITQVEISSTVSAIGDNSFTGCTSLDTVYLAGLKNYCGISFKYVEQSLSYKAKNFYINGESCEHIVIPDGVTAIGNYAFYNRTECVRVTIPASVERIGYSAFANATITDVNYGGTYGMWKNLDKTSGNSNLTTNTVTHYATSGAFGDIVWDVTDGVLTISGRGDMPDWESYDQIPWYGLSAKTAIIGEGITSIGSYGLYYGVIEDIYIPTTLKYVGKQVFNSDYTKAVYIKDLAAWCQVNFADSSPSYYHFHYSPFYRGAKLYVNGELLEDLVVPEGVEYIGDFVFSDYQYLKNVTLSDSVKYIGSNSFCGCKNLESVTVGDGLEDIGEYSFGFCASLVDLDLECENLKKIGEDAFHGCTGLTKLILPESVEEIEKNAFSGCEGVKNVFGFDNVKFVGEGAFLSFNIENVYITDLENWCRIDFESAQSNPLSSDSVLYINNVPVENLVIPYGITELKDYAFYNATNLADVTIPKTVKSIGRNVFDSVLKNIYYGGSQEEWNGIAGVDDNGKVFISSSTIIHYNCGELVLPDEEIGYDYSEDVITVVSHKDIQDAFIPVALYDETGRFMEAQFTVQDIKKGDNRIPSPMSGLTQNDKLKLMVWDGMGSMKPELPVFNQ